MAKKYVGLPLGGMIALCAILLLAPDSHGQGMTITRRTFTISGTTGVAGVTMQGFPVTGTTVTTDDNGVYTVEVPYEWSGTVHPVKAGYTFQPPEKTYTKVVTNSIKEDYKPTVMTYTITGTTGEPNVKLIGFPDEVTSNAAGSYTATVVYGWAGTVLPEKSGYRFEPPSISYGPINKDAKDQNYKAFELTYTISGTAGTAGVTLNVTGFPKPVISGADGAYRVEVRHDWSGTIKPVKDGVEFTPTERTYQTVMENQTNQDYQYRVFTYQITGTTGMAGVIMKGLPDDPITDGSGFYSATVTYGSSLKVVPEKPGFRFEPPLKQYTNVKTDYPNQDYKPSAIQLTISGNAGTGSVTLVGLPGDPQSDATGNYSAKVPFGFTNPVTPTKDGWSFEPPSYEYNSLAQDQVRQNFKAERIRFKITGNVGGVGPVTLMGFPTPVVSGPDGSYSADVDWNWSGIVIPRKEGYTFEPVSREYKNLQVSQASQDYQPLIMKHAITGRVVDEAGAPVPEVIVAAEGEPPVTTGPDGKFELKVTHRWQGRISFQRDGYDFSPSTRAFQTVIADGRPAGDHHGRDGRHRQVQHQSPLRLDGGPGIQQARPRVRSQYEAVHERHGGHRQPESKTRGATGGAATGDHDDHSAAADHDHPAAADDDDHPAAGDHDDPRGARAGERAGDSAADPAAQRGTDSVGDADQCVQAARSATAGRHGATVQRHPGGDQRTDGPDARGSARAPGNRAAGRRAHEAAGQSGAGSGAGAVAGSDQCSDGTGTANGRDHRGGYDGQAGPGTGAPEPLRRSIGGRGAARDRGEHNKNHI
jgi:hypothetical protein